MTTPFQFLQEFRQQLLGIFTYRADALFELIDALLLTLDPRSPIELSLSPAFRRRFASVYDALRQGRVDPELARQLLTSAEPAAAIQIAGCAVYATDSTIAARPDAETLPDRGYVYAADREHTVVGHQYNWLGRVIAQGQSWFAPREVERVATHTTPAAVAADQVKRLATTVTPPQRAVVVADSHYAKRAFLAAFLSLTNVFVLVRLACNRVLYYSPPPLTGQRPRGRPRLHGDKFKLQSPPEPERHGAFRFAKATVRASAWTGLHFKDLAALRGTVIRIEFLKADGQPLYQRPLWLFWSGPTSLSLEALCLMYVLRFGIEHFFRFAKQHLRLLIAQTPTLIACETWVWVVALAYTQLLLARPLVTALPRPWDPKARSDPQRPLTPGQVRRAWLAFSHGLGTPTAVPRPSGKAPGRAVGCKPQPRAKCPVISKRQNRVVVARA
ncbi:MAG: transposase [Chloroflexi bacterium]|nr:transposase [Chloroflexota bacterium]